MFFTRSKPAIVSFEQKLQKLRDAGFTVSAGEAGTTRVSRGVCAAELTSEPSIKHAGILAGNEIAAVVDMGFQKQLHTKSGVRLPVRAEYLKSLHAFLEDLREALGLTSLYNESIGSTNQAHLYDRVAGREK